jgi:hypothetical protein
MIIILSILESVKGRSLLSVDLAEILPTLRGKMSATLPATGQVALLLMRRTVRFFIRAPASHQPAAFWSLPKLLVNSAKAKKVRRSLKNAAFVFSYGKIDARFVKSAFATNLVEDGAI